MRKVPKAPKKRLLKAAKKSEIPGQLDLIEKTVGKGKNKKTEMHRPKPKEIKIPEW